MNAKRKMIIAISAFAMVILATVVAVVAVLAAQSVTIQSSINVTYSVTDVIADVEVYAVKVKTNASSITWDNSNKATYNFGDSYSGTGETLTLPTSSYTLAKDECVVLKFVFNNNSAKAFTATLTKPTAVTNVNIYYAASDTGTSGILKSTTTSPSAVSVASGAAATSSYYAVIKIGDISRNISTSSFNFNWALA